MCWPQNPCASMVGKDLMNIMCILCMETLHSSACLGHLIPLCAALFS